MKCKKFTLDDIPKVIVDNFYVPFEVLCKDECWPYYGSIDLSGYGRVGVNYKTIKTHRLSFLLTNGYLPDDLLVCHKCDNPSCVNPEHLFLGTTQDNTLDKTKKGRCLNQNKLKTHCNRGHEFDQNNTKYRMVYGRLRRDCLKCRNINNKNYYKTIKGALNVLPDVP